MKSLLIIGTGGQGKVVLDCALETTRYSHISFLTNDLEIESIAGYPIFHEQKLPPTENMNFAFYNDFDEVIVAIGNNSVRLEKSKQLLDFGVKLATLIHPKAVISRFSEINVGTVVFANTVINPFSQIGMACIINTGAIIEHDCILGDGVHVSPNAIIAGGCSIDNESWICIGSSIANNMHIGKNCIIGAGGVVLDDVENKTLVAGVPAKVKKKYD